MEKDQNMSMDFSQKGKADETLNLTTDKQDLLVIEDDIPQRSQTFNMSIIDAQRTRSISKSGSLASSLFWDANADGDLFQNVFKQPEIAHRRST